VLRALGRDARLAESSLRFSLGRFSTEAEVDRAVSEVRRAVERLRALSPAGPQAAGWGGAGAAGSVYMIEKQGRTPRDVVRFQLLIEGHLV
jgi:hypothetical protein